MLKRLAVILLLLYVVYMYAYMDSPIFVGGEGIYTVTTNGASDGKIYTFNTSKMYKFYTFKGITGQSLTTKNFDFIDDFLTKNNCELMFTEIVDGIEINYYYSPKIWGYKPVNGKKVNLEVAKNKGNFTIGTPLIYGSFQIYYIISEVYN